MCLMLLCTSGRPRPVSVAFGQQLFGGFWLTEPVSMSAEKSISGLIRQFRPRMSAFFGQNAHFRLKLPNFSVCQYSAILGAKFRCRRPTQKKLCRSTTSMHELLVLSHTTVKSTSCHCLSATFLLPNFQVPIPAPTWRLQGDCR